MWDQGVKLGRAYPNSGIVFGDDDGVIPDVLWVSRARLPTAVGADGRLPAAPELVVEVLPPGSDNVRRDQAVKLATDDRWGVEEYWNITYLERWVNQHRRVDGRLALNQRLGVDHTINTPTPPGLACPVAALFREIGRV